MTDRKNIARPVVFNALILVRNANPNGDIQSDNRPRMTSGGYGEISGECLRSKLRHTLLNMGENILQARESDIAQSEMGFSGLRKRACDADPRIQNLMDGKNEDGSKLTDRVVGQRQFTKAMCETWFDARAFGCLLTGGKKNGKKAEGDEDGEKNASGVSYGFSGPVNITVANSVEPIEVEMLSITKSHSIEQGPTRGSDTIGTKYIVPYALYVLHGTINPIEAEKTGFTQEDADKVKQAILHMFDDDGSGARPTGAITVARLYWYEGKEGEIRFPANPYFLHQEALRVTRRPEVEIPVTLTDYDIELREIEGVSCEVIDTAPTYKT